MIDDQSRVQTIESNINLNDSSQQTSTEMVNSTPFNFSRTSTRGVTPLISTLTTVSMSNDLNGTVVECLEVDGPMAVESTVILVIDINHCEFLINFMSVSHTIIIVMHSK